MFALCCQQIYEKMKYRPIGKKELLIIRQGLPHGYLKTISKRTGYSSTYVSRVLSAEYYNTFIINEAIKLHSENETSTMLLIKKIKKAKSRG
jgi:AraC-like DNA-binding protein